DRSAVEGSSWLNRFGLQPAPPDEHCRTGLSIQTAADHALRNAGGYDTLRGVGARSSRGPGRHPFKVEITGSNPARATRFTPLQRHKRRAAVGGFRVGVPCGNVVGTELPEIIAPACKQALHLPDYNRVISAFARSATRVACTHPHLRLLHSSAV